VQQQIQQRDKMIHAQQNRGSVFNKVEAQRNE
jgi:hypothetical protein